MKHLYRDMLRRPVCSAACSAALVVFLAAGAFFASCRSSPSVQPPPPSLVFDGITAETPDSLNLHFTLGIENPFPRGGRAALESWIAKVNGQAAGAGFALEGAGEDFPLQAGASASFPLALKMDVPALIAAGLAPEDYYDIDLIARLRFFPEGAAANGLEPIYVSGLAAFPGVRPPVFSITSIAILKAELINTRFRVGIRIENPNAYPVELSSLSYVLYGNGLLWADGTERNVIQIPANSFTEGNVFLLMNFMGMRRNLLDQIINLVDVSYRFAGEAQVSTGVEFLPAFATIFDLSGFSQVLER